jgi:hypothetical protein
MHIFRHTHEDTTGIETHRHTACASFQHSLNVKCGANTRLFCASTTKSRICWFEWGRKDIRRKQKERGENSNRRKKREKDPV